MSQPAMDAGAFTEMKELMGDAFKEVVSMCLQSLPEQTSQLEMAIAEMTNFPSIPVKVTINEYIELSKQYSTNKHRF